MSLFDITGRVALVTGSSRGLGRSLAEGLADAGASVILHGRNQDALTDTADAIERSTGSRPAAVSFDVTDADAVKDGVAQVIAEHGVPDILVNNAGVQRRAPFEEFAVEDWDAVISSNLSSAFYVSRFVVPGMVERRSGKIVNIASVQSKLARQTIAPYSASKGGLALLTQGMAADLARYDIQVNAISPGYFATEMNKDLVEDETFNNWLVNRTPAHRWGNFTELRGTLLYLVSDASSFVSGQNIFVDGGMTAVV
ncbi:gluconate 5-dehydrogenase [Okibacterium sp. HSC-33S16]|uniref:SDR family oxidoreductase n=1 Tax=Okibacterium sp. HSC-33S16 TaxID=2910965 RepID=UPI00209E232C|nr:SDR family oxidoreductase [Okibacterium sp. HSC-33S16]MCP2031141.1 gluconate 5-dehydrogenase [Okibacterium sp. HSC-33S16]